LLDKAVAPSEIIVLVQRKKAARVILNALTATEVRAKSYYEESQLETDDEQRRFAAFKLLLDKDHRVDISRAFLGRNSLLAGNLAGNLQNRADLLLFGLSWGHDCAQHQEVSRKFSGVTVTSCRRTGNSLGRTLLLVDSGRCPV
jgi:hypothetical protein